MVAVMLGGEQEQEQEQEHYAELGAAPGASHAQLKASYRRLLRALHPDRAGAGADRARLLRVQRAWAALREAGARARYDAQLAAAAHAAPALLDTLRLQDLRHDAPRAEYAWPCRCGGRYALGEEDARSSADLLLPCDTCSFHILVTAS